MLKIREFLLKNKSLPPKEKYCLTLHSPLQVHRQQIFIISRKIWKLGFCGNFVYSFSFQGKKMSTDLFFGIPVRDEKCFPSNPAPRPLRSRLLGSFLLLFLLLSLLLMGCFSKSLDLHQ